MLLNKQQKKRFFDDLEKHLELKDDRLLYKNQNIGPLEVYKVADKYIKYDNFIRPFLIVITEQPEMGKLIKIIEDLVSDDYNLLDSNLAEHIFKQSVYAYLLEFVRFCDNKFRIAGLMSAEEEDKLSHVKLATLFSAITEKKMLEPFIITSDDKAVKKAGMTQGKISGMSLMNSDEFKASVIKELETLIKLCQEVESDSTTISQNGISIVELLDTRLNNNYFSLFKYLHYHIEQGFYAIMDINLYTGGEHPRRQELVDANRKAGAIKRFLLLLMITERISRILVSFLRETKIDHHALDAEKQKFKAFKKLKANILKIKADIKKEYK